MQHQRILTEYTSDTRSFDRGARRYDRTLAHQERLTNTRLGRIDRRWERSTRTILNTRTALVSLTAGLGFVALRNYAEEWRNVERRLKSIGVTGGAAQKTMVDLALRTRSTLNATGASVSRFAKSTDGNFASATRRVETLQKLLAFGGASGGERASVSLQLGQALKSGVLAGDEFKSLSENAPIELLDALAKAAGITRGELKKFAADQKLTTAIVLEALDSLAESADKNFASMEISGEEAFTVLQTGMTAYIGAVDKSLGATASINGALVFLGEYASGAGEGAETLAAAIKIVGAVALATAGSRGIGALNTAFRDAAEGRRADVVAAKAQVTANQKLIAQSRVSLDAANVKQRAAQQELAFRQKTGAATVKAAKAAALADRRQVKASNALAGAHVRAKLATDSLTAAQARLSVATRVSTATQRAFRATVSFFGGPIGFAITALTLVVAVMGQFGTASEAATKIAGEVTEGISDMGKAYRDANGDIKQFRENLESVTVTQAVSNVIKLDEEIGKLRAEIGKDLKVKTAFSFLTFWDRDLSDQLVALGNGLSDGKLTVKEFRAELDALAQGNPEIRKLATEILNSSDKLLKHTESAEKARAVVMALAGTEEQAGEAAITLGLALDVASGSAGNLATQARSAQDGIAGLIAAIPELEKAAKIQTKIAKATSDRDKALAGLSGGGAETAAERRRINDLFDRATKAIDGTADATRKADKDLKTYLDRSKIDALDGRSRALEREAQKFDKITVALKASGAAEADIEAARVAHENNKAAIDKQFDTKAAKGGSRGAAKAARDDERQLAEARDLLVENGQKAIFIEQALIEAREKLIELMPALIASGLSRAEAEKVVASELERVKERLDDVRTADEERSATFAKNILEDIRAADSLGDAIGGIAKRLADLALDRSFDLLADQFSKLISSMSGKGGGGGLGDFIGKAIGSIFGGVPKNAAGGLLRGRGTGTSDSNLTYYSDGEFMVNAAATKANLPLLDAINRGVTIPRQPGGGIEGALAGAAAGVSGLVVNVINQVSGVEVTATPKSGGREVDVFVKKMVNDHISSGGADRALLGRFGSKPLPQGG